MKGRKTVTVTFRTRFITLFVIGLLSIAIGGDARAQGTPTPGGSLTPYTFSAPFAPAADQCTTAAASTDTVASLLATPVPATTPAVTDHGIVALPGGVPVDETTATAVDDVLTQMWACNNARNKAAILSLFTDQAIQQLFGNTTNAPFEMADLRADVAAALTPGEPRTAGDLASIDAVVSILQQSDGQIGVLVLNTDPDVAEGDQVLDYFAFVSDGGASKVSNVILDPFDLTPDYGFEKSA
jgi:hypothetical protein